jgi:hypothetical protein
MHGRGGREYSVAKGYVQSAFLIVTNPARMTVPDDRSFVLAVSQLFGFAAELYFKGFLIASGVEPRVLRNSIVRHNLAKLHEMSIERGLSLELASWLVEVLGTQHKSHEFRYMTEQSSYTALDLTRAFAAFSELDLIVDAFIGASAAFGLTPRRGWDLPRHLAWRLPVQYYCWHPTRVELKAAP